jgi:hypothetical protein
LTPRARPPLTRQAFDAAAGMGRHAAIANRRPPRSTFSAQPVRVLFPFGKIRIWAGRVRHAGPIDRSMVGWSDGRGRAWSRGRRALPWEPESAGRAVQLAGIEGEPGRARCSPNWRAEASAIRELHLRPQRASEGLSTVRFGKGRGQRASETPAALCSGARCQQACGPSFKRADV